MVKRGLCQRCGIYIGKVSVLRRRGQDLVPCRYCGHETRLSKMKYFYNLSLKKQLQIFLNRRGAAHLLQYRERRVKIAPGGLEDIMDGSEYIRLQEEGQPLASNLNFSMSMNTDGVQLTKSRKTSMHPVYVRINEVHPRVRQTQIFLAALWIGDKEPDYNMLLKLFVREANEWYDVGIRWKPDGVNEVVSKFIPAVCAVDAKARCGLLNQTQHNGHSSCPFCTHVGVSIPDGPCKFPAPGTVLMLPRRVRGEDVLVRYVVPECQPRTPESMREDLLQANTSGQLVRGIKPGLCPLFHMRGFGLGHFCSPDDLHPIYEGVAKFHTSLLVSQCHLNEDRQRIVGNRMLAVKTPSNISRKTTDFSHVAKWKGSQWRTWLLYLAVPCLQNLGDGFDPKYVRHIELLSHAIFLLSRDIITEEDLELADRYLKRYSQLFQEYFGPETMRFNVHILLHLVEAVRRWEPLQFQSTFGPESWNYKLKQKVTSPFGAIDQIVDRHLLSALVESFPYNEELSERIRNHIQAILLSSKLHVNALRVGDAYLLGPGNERAVTDAEREILEEIGYDCRQLVQFEKVTLQNRMIAPFHMQMSMIPVQMIP